MWYTSTLFLASAVMVIGMSVSFTLVDGQLPLVAFLLPLLCFTRAPQTSFWIILLAITAYAMVVPHQPISHSVGVWMLLPGFYLLVRQNRCWQVSLLVLCVMFSMQLGVMVLQSEQKLTGMMQYSLLQNAVIFTLGFALYCWKPIEKVNTWPWLLLPALWLIDGIWVALFSFCATVLLISFHEISKQAQLRGSAEKLSVLLPAIGFVTLLVMPQTQVPNPIFVAWMLCLMMSWLGDYLIKHTITEEE